MAVRISFQMLILTKVVRMSERKNAVIYSRVSTKEQAIGGFSLQNQERECKRFAENSGFTVLKCFQNIEGESAKTTRRPALIDMLEYVAKNKGQIDAVIVWKYDRFSRNAGDGGMLLNNLGLLGIDVISATEPADMTAAGKFLKNILLSAAQFDNDVRSERTVGGMSQAVREGRWQWRAPIGYRYDMQIDGKKVIVPDARASYVKKAFALAATGSYTQIEICRMLRREGAKISAQMLNRMLRNYVYAGYILKKEWHPEPVKGIHEPLISLDMFQRVQRILLKNRPGYRPRIQNDPDFPLRNFVTCSCSGQRITGSRSTGRQKVRYAYYHCRQGKCGFGSVPQQELHRQFSELLRSIQPEPGTVDLFREIMRETWQEKHRDITQEKRRVQTEINGIEEYRDNALQLFIKGKITDQEYQKATGSIALRVEVLKEELASLRADGPNLQGALQYCCDKLTDIADTWMSGGIEVKQRFQSLIFPNGITHDGRSFETAQTAIIFKVLQEFSGEKSRMASPTGFEPVLSP